MPESGCDEVSQRDSRTLYLLALVKHDITGNFHGIANKSIATGVLNGTFNSRLVLDYIHCEPRPFGERPVLVIDGFHLDAIKRDERCVTRAVVAHILEAIPLSACIPKGKYHLPQYNRWRSFPLRQQPHPCFYPERLQPPIRTSSGLVCISQQHVRGHLRPRSVTESQTGKRCIPGKILDRLVSVSLSLASFSDS